MTEPTNLHETLAHESLTLPRGLAIFGGLLAGASAAVTLIPKAAMLGLPGLDVAGPFSIGTVPPGQVWLAAGVCLAAAVGAGAGWWVWQALARLIGRICPLPAAAALKRSALPFIAWLPQMAALPLGQAQALEPLILTAALAAGVLLWAFAERQDKRKIFFAHPTETEYSPASLFTQGSVLLLGAGAGWFLQSLTGFQFPFLSGLGFALACGIAVWMASLVLGMLLGILYTKHTFNQVYHAVAFALLPLALLPLKSATWLAYGVAGKTVGGFHLPLFSLLLPLAAVAGFFTILVISLLALRTRPLENQVAWEEVFRALMLLAAGPLLIFALAFWPGGTPWGQPSLAGPLDLLREGEPLASAQAILQGRLPFKEILFRHGFLTDAVSSLTAMGWFGPTAEGYRWLLAWLYPLGAVGLYLLAIFTLPWVWALWAMLLLLTGWLGLLPAAQYVFAFVGFLFTLQYIQKGQWPVLIFSGVATALAWIGSYSAGIVATAGHGVLLMVYGFWGSAENPRRWAGLPLYLAAAVVGLVPWWLYLAMSGSLSAFFTNFAWVISNYAAVFARPVPGWSLPLSWTEVVAFAMPPLALVLGLFHLGAALPRAKERPLPWNVLLLTTVLGLLWMRYLQNAQPEFLHQAMPVALLLMAFFGYRLGAHNPRLRGVVLAGALGLAFLPMPGHWQLPHVFGNFGVKNVVSVGDYGKSTLAALGGVYLPGSQAQELAQTAAYLEGQVGSAETFYDFSNQPFYYFLVPRRPAVASLATAMLATWDQQAEAIRSLDEAKVKAVLLAPAAGRTPGAIPAEIRQYAVAEYLWRNYAPVAQKGGVIIAVPRSEAVSPESGIQAALIQPLDLGWLPARWARLPKYAATPENNAGALAPVGGVKAVEPAGVSVTAAGGALEIGEASGPTSVRLALPAAVPGRTANVLLVTLKTSARLEGEQAQWHWGEAGSGRTASFTLAGHGADAVTYAFRVGSWPGWALAQSLTEVTLRLPRGGWRFEQAALLSVRDIPQLLARAAAPTAPAPAAGKPAKAVKPGAGAKPVKP